jgi:arylsulfatase A-like enzyme
MRTTDGWKLIWYPQAKRTQLFHVPEDAHEQHNLAQDPAQQDRVQLMMKQLKTWLRDQGDPLGNE